MFSTKHPVRTATDLQGMKIRTGGGISEAMVRALGASAVVTSVPQECRELLRSGIADGAFFPQDSFVSFELQNLVRYATLFPGGFFNYSFGFFMNEAKWNGLSRQDQELITKFGGEYLARRAGNDANLKLNPSSIVHQGRSSGLAGDTTTHAHAFSRVQWLELTID